MSKIILLGDLAFGGLIGHDPDNNPERFSAVAPILKSADLVFANLEIPIKEGIIQNKYKVIVHSSNVEVTKLLLLNLNIRCVSLANNHIYDFTMPGLKATINLLDTLGIYHTGAGWKEEHINPVIISDNETRLAFIAYVDKNTNPCTEQFPELFINFLTKKL